jgi:hypothetical protein
MAILIQHKETYSGKTTIIGINFKVANKIRPFWAVLNQHLMHVIVMYWLQPQ